MLQKKQKRKTFVKKTILFFFCFLCFNHVAYPLSDFEDIKDFIEKYRTDYKTMHDKNDQKSLEIEKKIKKTDQKTLTKKIENDKASFLNGLTLYDLAEENNLLSVRCDLFNRAFELKLDMKKLSPKLNSPVRCFELAVECYNKQAASSYLKKFEKDKPEKFFAGKLFNDLMEKSKSLTEQKSRYYAPQFDLTDITKKFISHTHKIGLDPLSLCITMDNKSALACALAQDKPDIALEIIKNIDNSNIKNQTDYYVQQMKHALKVSLQKGFEHIFNALATTIETNKEISWVELLPGQEISDHIFSKEQRALQFVYRIKRYGTAKLFMKKKGAFDRALEKNFDSVAQALIKKALELKLPLKEISKKEKEKVLGFLIKNNKPEIAKEIIESAEPYDPVLTAIFEEKTPKQWAKEKTMPSITQLLQKKEGEEKEEQERVLAHLAQALKMLL